jgi:hypothetical protein
VVVARKKSLGGNAGMTAQFPLFCTAQNIVVDVDADDGDERRKGNR